MAYLKRWPHTYQSAGLAKWRAARATAASQPVDVVYYGNSLTQDGGSPVRFIQGGYPSHVGNWMNAKLGKQHGVGFDCARINGGDLHWTYGDNSGLKATYNPTGAFQPGTVGHTTGFGLWSCALVPTDTLTYTWVMDRFDILYVKTKTYGVTVEVRIDGVLQGSFNTQDAGQSGSTLGTFDASNVWTSPALTNESHTVTLTNVGSGTDLAYIEGIYVYNTNYDSGFRFWNGAHSGYWGAYHNNNTAPNSFDIIKKRQPALAVWGHFFNDKNGGTNSAYITAATNFISKVRSYSPNTDILLTTEWQCAGWPSTAASYTDMRNAVLFLAAVNGIGVIDLGEFTESVGYNGTETDPFKWVKPMPDGTHQLSADSFMQWAKIHYAYLNDIKPPVRPQGY